MVSTDPPADAPAGGGDAPPVEILRACYEAFAERRLRRGARSLRTRQGYEQLRGKYQPRLRLVADAHASEQARVAEHATDAKKVREAEKTIEGDKCEASARYSDQEDDDEDAAARNRRAPRVPIPVSSSAMDHVVSTAQERPLSDVDDHESETSAFQQLVGVFFDARVKRFVLETAWPLAHHGGGSNIDGAKSSAVPEWQELDEHQYFAFMYKTLVWLFPGLPAFEAQELTEWDWSKDCEFDAFGSVGLSFEGFMVSMLDLALACTDGSAEKCLEFLIHLTKRLDASLPIVRVPTTTVLPSPSDDDSGTYEVTPHEPIVWKTIPLERLYPCPVRVRPQFLELKTKLSAAPVILMVLAEIERPLELQLSTSAKLLVRERDHRNSIRRNTMQSNTLSHFIEIEKQFLWTFRSFPAQPTLVIVPSGLISKRTLSLYGCCRLLESHEHSLGRGGSPQSDVDPILTMFTAVQEPFPLLYGTPNSLCGRIDRHGSRLFVIDHRAHDAKSFKIVFKTSLIHNTSSAGGAGAAGIITSLANINSTGTARCKSELVGGGSSQQVQSTPHSFIFVVRLTSDVLAHGPQGWLASTVGAGKGTSKSSEASVPAQWFTTLSGANENKTIYIDTCNGEDEAENSLAGIYYVYVFTLHGFYFEAMCEEENCDNSTESANDCSSDSPLNILTGADQSQSRSAADKGPRSSLYATGDKDVDVDGDFHIGTLSEAKPSMHSVTTSATLLRQLLHLRRQRQLRATSMPTPECVGGSRITSVKALTSAAGLRAKFLKARAEERRSRLLHNEEQFRSKVLSKLMKVESKRRALRGGLVERDFQPTKESAAQSAATPLSADLEAKATLMVNFFEEMAAYQPPQREIDEGGNGEENQEDELLENFADLFHDDHALQNMLDQEKWMSSDVKKERRRSLLDERKKARRRSLVELNQRQVPQLDDGINGGDGDVAQESERKKSGAVRASEDYYSTAALISQLMREVADEGHASNESTDKDNNKKQGEKDSDRLKQLAASWGMANTMVMAQGYNVLHPETRFEVNQDEIHTPELHKLEEVRRDEWLASHHVQDIANNERLRQRHPILRPTLTPTHQAFQEQEEELPWQPVWVVDSDYHDGTGITRGKVHDDVSHIKPRPKTASYAVHTPHPPLRSVGRDRSSVVRGSTLARQHAHRIRSAQHTNRVHAMAKEDSANLTGCALSRIPPGEEREGVVSFIPQAFLCDPYSFVSSSLDHIELPTNAESPTLEVKLALPPTETFGECEPCGQSETSNVHLSNPADVHQIHPKARLKKKKKLTTDEKRFGRRVRELLSISPLLQSFAQGDSR